MNTKPEKQENNRNPDGTFKKGMSGNLLGRPVGKTLKEYQAQKFREMSDKDKEEFLKDIAKEIRWKMSEGNPETKSDITSDGQPLQVIIPPQIAEAYNIDATNTETIKRNTEQE